MSKELEALQTLKFIENPTKDYHLWRQSIEIIEQALKPKTADEIKEMLSEYFEDTINYDWTLGFTKGKEKELIYWYENGEIEIYPKLPPHIITTIGQFYEAKEKDE